MRDCFRASLKRESTQFEPMRKPDILKLRRESLSKIMLMRKTEQSRRVELKETTRTKSPLLSALSPRKRKPDLRGTAGETASPKLKKIAESPEVMAAVAVLKASPAVRKTPPRKAKERVAPTPPPSAKPAAHQPAKGSSPAPRPKPKIEETSPVELRKKPTRTEFRRQPRNSLRSLSLNRNAKLKKEEKKMVFRSPSIYDEPKPVRPAEEVS